MVRAEYVCRICVPNMCAEFDWGPTVVSKKKWGGGYRRTDRQADRQTDRQTDKGTQQLYIIDYTSILIPLIIHPFSYTGHSHIVNMSSNIMLLIKHPFSYC